MRKIAIFLLFILLFSAGVSAAELDSPDMRVELLSALNIIDKEERDAEDFVSRGEFASIITRFMGNEEVSGIYDGEFADVTEYNEYYNAIYYLRDNKIISGAGDGNFYPEAPITKRNAAIVVARAMGYGVLSESIEGYASKLGIIAMTNDNLKYDELLSMLYEALDCEVIVRETSLQPTYVRHKNYLSKVFGVYEGKGVVKSNSLTTIDGTGTGSKDAVRIEKHLMNNGGVDVDDLLGMSVQYYYVSGEWRNNESGEDTLMCAVATSKNKVREILARDIISFDGRTLKYYHNESSRNIQIDAGVDVIYNGVACPDYELAMLSPQAGKITYIDNGTDSACIKVESYTNSIVSLVDDEAVYLKDGTKIEFDSFSYDFLAFYDKDGNVAEEIPVNSVLSIYKSNNGKVLKAVYSTDVIEDAKVTNYDDDFIETETDKLYVNKLYTNWISAIGDAASRRYKFFLDAFGEVAKIEKYLSGENFGYLISIGDVTEGGELYVKMLMDSSDIDIIQCAEKVYVDGMKVKIENLKSTLTYDGKVEQLIIFGLDEDGKLTTIKTPQNRDTYTGSIYDMKLDDFKISYKGGSTEYYKTATKVFGTTCPLDESTKIFFIADNPKNISNDYYWAGSISSIDNDEKAASVVGYKTTSKLASAEAMVVYGAGGGGNIGNEARLAVVQSIKSTVNDEFEPRTRVTFITAGKLVAYNLRSDIKPEDFNLSKGDVVRFAIDRKYEVSAIEVICDLKKDGSMALRYGAGNNYENTNNSGGAVYRVASGSVYDYEDGLLCVSKGDVNGIDIENPQFEFYRGVQDAFICVIDGKEIYAGSVEDMIGYADNSTEYSKIFITTRYGVPRDVVIYK